MKTGSNLERVLEAGHFAVTAEISPPVEADLDIIRDKVDLIGDYVDACNIPDGQAAVVAMASWAGCLIGLQEGLDPIIHMTCRDRNRIALQMDILATAAFGVNNILCLSGDPISSGNHPDAKPVFDVDAVRLIGMLKRIREEKKLDNGELISGRELRFFIGGTANPFAQPSEPVLHRLQSRVVAGADFIQTQSVYDVEGFRRWMELVRRQGFHRDVSIVAGITPVTSLAAARYMQTKLPNSGISDAIIDRFAKVRKREEAAEEGLRIAVETIEQLRQIEGVAGVHIMTLQREETIPEICRAAGLYPRP
ncbi:MAG: methylenetetrahydrofolate reductase [Dehalococcoidia bacterium]